MFRSAALKLTFWYLAIIVALSIGFSLALYSLSSDDLTRNARRQVSFFKANLTPDDFTTYVRLREKQLHEDLGHIRDNLLIFNLIVLLTGGAASYGLARRTLRPIEESLEAQTRFAGDASHELRTPLAAMQTEIEVALRNPSLTKALAIKLLQSNLEEVAKLKALSDGLLRLSTTESKQVFDQEVPLKKVVEKAAERWDKIASTKKITIKTELSDVRTYGDEQSLVDLVSILLDNAIKYSPKNSEVSIRVYRKDKNAYVSISDKGIGIKAEDLPRIFERFYRTDSSRSKKHTGGYGLGLAIAKKIADLHGGSIEVKSARERGATFTIQLPAA